MGIDLIIAAAFGFWYGASVTIMYRRRMTEIMGY